MVAQTRFPETRRGGLRRATGYGVGIAAVVAIVLIGNLRVQAAESGRPAEAPLVGTPVSLPASDRSRLMAVRGEPAIDEDTDGFEVVPAIYARNPDVRVVYDRRVRNWM